MMLYFVYLSSPFYGEDFYCEIPRSFRHLSFYIFDRDVFRRDSIIGRYLNESFFIFLVSSEQDLILGEVGHP